MARRFALSLAFLAVLLLGACGGGGGVTDALLDSGTSPSEEPPPAPPSEPPPPAPPPVEPPPATSMSATELAKAEEVLVIVNAERDAEGLPPLTWDDGASEVAYQHSRDMDIRDYFSHTNPDGLLPWDRLTAAGVPYGGAGENIFWASWHASATQAMDAWMDSTGHRNNILGGSWTHIGIGVHEGSGGSWWTQVFMSR